MKRVLAILFVLAMLFSVVACNKADDKPSASSEAPATSQAPSESTAPSASAPPSTAVAPPSPTGGTQVDVGSGQGAAAEKTEERAYPNANPDGSINLDTVAHYDVNYDYSQNDKIKCTYIAQSGGALYSMSAAAYEHWAPLYNMEWYGFQNSDGDTDLFNTMLQNSLDQGVRAFILDPDTTMIPAVKAIMDKYPDAAWLTQMAAPRDGASGAGVPPGGNMVNNYVGFDNYDAGIQVTKKVLEWKEENIPNVPWDEIAFLCPAFSTSPPLNQRVDATRDLWLETAGSLDNFFTADASTFGINFQGFLDAVTPVITTNTDYRYWLVNGLIDDGAMAAAAVLDQLGLTDNCCIACFGGSGWVTKTDAGQEDAFRYALFTAQNLYAEPIIGGVYAFLQGWATPDSIWPSWVKWDDHGTGNHTYSQLRLPTVWLATETYQHYLAWTDMYATANAFPNYPNAGITLDAYSPFVPEVPADFKAP